MLASQSSSPHLIVPLRYSLFVLYPKCSPMLPYTTPKCHPTPHPKCLPYATSKMSTLCPVPNVYPTPHQMSTLRHSNSTYNTTHLHKHYSHIVRFSANILPPQAHTHTHAIPTTQHTPHTPTPTHLVRYTSRDYNHITRANIITLTRLPSKLYSSSAYKYSQRLL